GDGIRVGVLDVDEERAGAGIFETANGLVGRADAVDRNAPNPVPILFEIGIAEDPDRTRIGFDLLDDEIVVLAGFDVGAVLAKARADRLELGLVALLERGHAGICLAWRSEDQLAKRVARAGRRRWTVN